MSQQITSQTTSADGLWVTTSYDDGSVQVTPAVGSPVAVAQGNVQSLQQKAQQALTVNATFQALANPSNAQNAAQVQALTKQCNGIIRLLLGLVDSTTGT